MANDEHLAILRQGVEAWNEWRVRRPAVTPDLIKSDLRGATLDGVNLSRADLIEADLQKAALGGADLHRADLRGADLRGADLGGARLYETVLADVDLSDTKGLDSCVHHGPSIVDHRTLECSGRLPIDFLRGVGLPDIVIDQL